MNQFILFKEVRIHYSDSGAGKAIVLLHGFLSSMTMWNNLKPHLLKTHRVICIDLLGHGNTESLSETHSMELMAEAVKSVLDHLEIHQFVLIGHSMGGYVSLSLAELYPNHILGLCLMNSTAQEDSEDRKINRDRTIAIVHQNHKAFIRMAIPNLYAETNRAKFVNEIKTRIDQALSMTPIGISAALAGMKIRKDHTVMFQKAKYKKMLIIGKHDPVLDYTSLINESTNTDIEVVELDGGHMSHYENNEEFTYNILHFIEKL